MSILSKWKAIESQQKIILIACLALFLPFYITCIIHLLLLLYTMIKGDLKKAYQEIKNTRYVLYFTLLSTVVSLVYQNYVGVLCSFAVLLIASMVIYVQRFGDQNLFKIILKLFVFMSILCAIYGLMEYNGILNTVGMEDFEVVVMDSPKLRLNSVFFNANYYAMMIEFFVLMAFYLLIYEKNKWHILYYLAVMALNLFMLYLSGCRTAWAGIAAGFFMLVVHHPDRRWLLGYLSICCFMLLAFAFDPSIFPRFDNIEGYFMRRVKIWQVSIENIISHPLFGEGPLTYMNIYHLYAGAKYTQHAHNIFLDPFLSHGIVGVVCIYPYFKARFQEWKLQPKDNTYRYLMRAIVATTIIHGLFDYTVYFVPTGFTFLMILASTFQSQKTEI